MQITKSLEKSVEKLERTGENSNKSFEGKRVVKLVTPANLIDVQNYLEEDSRDQQAVKRQESGDDES